LVSPLPATDNRSHRKYSSFATQPGSVAPDGTGRNSTYTRALADTIRRPGLGIFDAFNQVGLQVKRATKGGAAALGLELSDRRRLLFRFASGAVNGDPSSWASARPRKRSDTQSSMT
jgi:uncharacterized caspase-like protein